MSTRGAIGFRLMKKDKVFYNHSGSYPGYLGVNILQFIQGETRESLRCIASSILMVDERTRPTAQQIEECQAYFVTAQGISKDLHHMAWYDVLRGVQGNLSAYKTGLKYMLDSSNFLLNSLFCEYAYIINLDNNTLEFYSGYNQKPYKSKGRYANKDGGNGYYGVVLIASFPLDTIIGASPQVLEELVETMTTKAYKFSTTQAKQLKKELDYV